MSLDYVPILFQIVIAVVVAVSMLGGAILIGQRGRRTPAKDTAYECGKDPIGPTNPRFSVKFYMVAMLFILFDIETVFFFAWAVVYRQELANGPQILFGMLFFLAVLGVGLVYELRKKALDWTRHG
ncbi:NADH-quinone oxidoreductase subunit A [Methylacidimicrobium tartarophylax]|jgi:NADH-quinone oxidoreductase subunit A|uniref:NADH-quinone oxidoreductase subunit A n=1 Tax=Methylacidimicrobium tartarophylax TaxID=1041768 RepID=A0A5E6MLW0_9BACT|nr:NADH-quinone oxidoreductase subunit A [Methylacidimicrobium tartarophylax]VVM07058.1 NADH-quinone oxidoreductase subunit A [Methylacidimicrobium tartarophylax]